jgi:hypothetical protein
MDYLGNYRSENRGRFWDVRALASGIETLNFYGFGNETTASSKTSYYQVRSKTIGAAVRAFFEPSRYLRYYVGPVARYTDTDPDQQNYLSLTDPLGTGVVTQFGLLAGLHFNNRTFPGEPDFRDTGDLRRWGPPPVGPGWSVALDGEYYGNSQKLDGAYGFLRGNAEYSHWFTVQGPDLTLRLGGQKDWGSYPFFDAAFLGSDEVRGLPANRFAGDGVFFANVDLRVRVGRAQLLIPGYWGFSLRGDTGRVFLVGEASTTWHGGYGGGLWFVPWTQDTQLSLFVATSDEDTRGYLLLGYGF